jgi:hypothetical protein
MNFLLPNAYSDVAAQPPQHACVRSRLCISLGVAVACSSRFGWRVAVPPGDRKPVRVVQHACRLLQEGALCGQKQVLATTHTQGTSNSPLSFAIGGPGTRHQTPLGLVLPLVLRNPTHWVYTPLPEATALPELIHEIIFY